MKLLICVQAVDRDDDPLMGFFHGWLIEFSKHFESIEVICLKEGHHNLPANVHVHSLGKETGESRLKYIARFYAYLGSLRGTYDRVFVHMNPHYVLLGGLYWRVCRIPVFFWRNHAKMNLMTRIAARFSKNVFYTSPYACTSVFKHAIQMPVGIDTTVFVPLLTTKLHEYPKKILFLGRLSPVKRVELFLEVSKILTEEYEFHLYGDDPSKEKIYEKRLRSLAGSHVFFHPAIKNEDTPTIYQTHDLYVNLTPEGSMDKTVLEAIACGIPTLVANTSFRDLLPQSSLLTPITKEQLANQIVMCVNRSTEEQRQILEYSRSVVAGKHSLEKLATMLYNIMR
jgi:glycosyltransferase involved in cell wall biosynthesis